MGMWRYKCTRCEQESIECKTGDRCIHCGLGRFVKFELIPDEYMNDLAGRSYRQRLEALRQSLKSGKVNRIQFLALKAELDRTMPNPKVNWKRLPKSYHTIHEIDGWQTEAPKVKIVDNVDREPMTDKQKKRLARMLYDAKQAGKKELIIPTT